jgi:hypothetical protein
MIGTQSLEKRLDTKCALIYFFVAYTIVTVLATATTVVYGIVNRMPENEPGVSLLNDPSFTATVPYQVSSAAADVSGHYSLAKGETKKAM